MQTKGMWVDAGGLWAAHLLVDRHVGRCGSHYKKTHLETRHQRKNLYVHSPNLKLR